MIDLELTPAQRDLLTSIPGRFVLERIDRVWIFPAHLVEGRETGLFVVSLFPDDEATSRRTLLTLRYQAEVVRGKVQCTESLSEEGRAPPERIELVVSGVLARAGEDFSDPLLASIEGNPDRWAELLERLGLAG